MDLDDVLPQVGEFGRYQKLVLWFILLPGVFPCGFHAYNQLFMAATPDHWCRIKELEEYDARLVRNISIPTVVLLDGQTRFSQCTMYDLNYTNSLEFYESVNYTNVRTVPCEHGWVYDKEGHENTIITEWDLVCDKDLSATLALVLLGLGGLLGNYFFGYVQDGIGRKPAFFIYLFIQCVFGIATAFANNFATWAIFRFGVGFTVPAILGTPYVLAIELVGPRHRTLVTILINIAYSLALVSLAIIVWVIREWRMLALATTLPFLTLFLHWWLLPESPRWLLAQGRIKEAEKILLQMGKINGKKLPENFILSLTTQDMNQNVVQIDYGIRHLFQSPNLRWKTIIVTFIWFTNTSVYVGLSYYAPALGGDEFLNFFLAGAVELPTYLFLWPAMEKWGRRWSLCVSMVVGGSACLATFLVQNDSVITLGLYCIGKMGISSSFVVLPLMASELYPTVVRGLGMSVSSMMGMLGPVFIPMVNYLGSDMLTLPLIIMGTMLVMGGACSLLLPETLNQHLPQTLQDAEKAGLDCFACCTPPQLDSKIRAMHESRF
ncbi:beta-alanine transporter [Tribolium madens]|uniref:beta-alanine transporter n=1 Tax=Tribolium madens TaxID=41895 RepID=UPI001CF75CDC|nr:beta-alanine transporter [Tribolium madens]